MLCNHTFDYILQNIIPLHDDQSTASTYKHFGKYFNLAIIPNQTWRRILKWRNSKERMTCSNGNHYFDSLRSSSIKGEEETPYSMKQVTNAHTVPLWSSKDVWCLPFTFFWEALFANGHWQPFWNASVWTWMFPKPPSH